MTQFKAASDWSAGANNLASKDRLPKNAVRHAAGDLAQAWPHRARIPHRLTAIGGRAISICAVCDTDTHRRGHARSSAVGRPRTIHTGDATVQRWRPTLRQGGPLGGVPGGRSTAVARGAPRGQHCGGRGYRWRFRAGACSRCGSGSRRTCAPSRSACSIAPAVSWTPWRSGSSSTWA